MLALLQRVTEASVSIDGRIVGRIDAGLCVFIGVEKGDQEHHADRLLERILGYRIFPDDRDKMNRSVTDMHGGLLLVPQFTLPADTTSGMRPSLSPAATPEIARRLFAYLLKQAHARYGHVASGEFGVHMQVTLINDGPVTFMLQVPHSKPSTEEDK